eukprot:Skav229603  [mRNA]  locus=scaffold510:225750:228890:+ [translate_table: standard]
MASNAKRSRRRHTEKGFRPYHSVSVPKSVDLVHSGQIGDRPKTTVMLRNIPNRYSQASLLEEIDHAGFKGSYDFFYLPMDTQNRTNVGYAFINFLTTEELERFMVEFANHAFKHHSSQKLARVSLAHVQGFIENIRHFSNRAVAHSRNNQYRPIVIHNEVRMDISEASALLCSIQSDGREGRPAAAMASTASSSSSRATPMASMAKPYTPSPPEAAYAPYARPACPSERGFSEVDWPLAPLEEAFGLGAVAEESDAVGLSHAREDFEKALSVLLSSYPPPAPPAPAALSHAYAHSYQPYAYQRQESHEDDERTQGGSAPVSPRRDHFAKSPFPADPHGQSMDTNMATPRTNRTLFIHGRFSA